MTGEINKGRENVADMDDAKEGKKERSEGTAGSLLNNPTIYIYIYIYIHIYVDRNNELSVREGLNR